ncbi:hypothetical protein Hanom_Chr06g00564831 [Helianthus anomalus]
MRARAWLGLSFVFEARARLVSSLSNSSSVQARLVYYLLINILNKNNIIADFFWLASSISEARARARLLNKLIFRFGLCS